MLLIFSSPWYSCISSPASGISDHGISKKFAFHLREKTLSSLFHHLSLSCYHRRLSTSSPLSYRLFQRNMCILFGCSSMLTNLESGIWFIFEEKRLPSQIPISSLNLSKACLYHQKQQTKSLDAEIVHLLLLCFNLCREQISASDCLLTRKREAFDSWDAVQHEKAWKKHSIFGILDTFFSFSLLLTLSSSCWDVRKEPRQTKVKLRESLDMYHDLQIWSQLFR